MKMMNNHNLKEKKKMMKMMTKAARKLERKEKPRIHSKTQEESKDKNW